MQPDHQLYTYSYLYKITSTSPSFIHKMIGLFVSSLDEYISELKTLEKSRNFEELRKVLHKMKPGVMNLEIKGAGEVLKYVSAAEAWDDQISVRVNKLIEIFIKIKPLMEGDLEELGKELPNDIS